MRKNTGLILIIISVFMLFAMSNPKIESPPETRMIAFIFLVAVPFFAGIFIYFKSNNNKK